MLLLVVQIQKCFVLYVKKQGKATFLPRVAKIIKGVHCFVIWPPQATKMTLKFLKEGRNFKRPKLVRCLKPQMH